jgi:hypothetical protein
MKSIALLILFAACQYCFGEEPKVIAISDWSKPVDGCNGFFNGGNCATIRGRLVILQGHFPGDASELLSTMVYLELQNMSIRGTEIYFDPNKIDSELCDATNKSVAKSGGGFSGICPDAYWVTLERDCSVRLRADCFGIRSPKEGGLVIPMPRGKWWFIKPNDTNDYFLSASLTFDAPTNHVSDDVKHARNVVWDGTLTFPKMKISLVNQ